MAGDYRLFYVTSWSISPGRGVEARAWYQKAQALWARLPGVKSIDVYVPQFGFAHADLGFEAWVEIEDYATLDRWDQAMGELGDEFIALNRDAEGVVQQGASRLMGEWFGSSVHDLKGS